MKTSRFKILLCASACSPDAGSEPGVGWAAYQALRQRHQVRVFCSACRQAAIEKAANEGEAELGDFIFIPETIRNLGFPAADKLICWLNFWIFQRKVKKLGKMQIQEFRPDLIHQVTLATWRAPNPLSGIGIPFVWGPVGGAEKMPAAFFSGISLYSALFEILRTISNFVSQHHPGVRQTARQASWIFAGNRATQEVLASLRGHSRNLELLPVVSFPASRLDEFVPRTDEPSAAGAPIRLFSGGYVEARKGIGLALQALARLKARGYKFSYEHGGLGPEESHLMAQARRLNLHDTFSFVAPYRGAAYREKLRGTDIFLFPSLRDNCPVTLLEAMGHGCVPIVADHAGPGEIVTLECGIKIPVTHPAEFVDRLTEALADLFADAGRRKRLGESARRRVIEKFSRQNWLSKVEDAYECVVRPERPSLFFAP